MSGGNVWNRLHAEREDICEALLKEPCASSEIETAAHEISKAGPTSAASWHKELLQARLRKIDDALDRLTSGSYGSCGKCGRWIEDTKLDFDPAIAFCIDCWERHLRQYDTGSLRGSQSQTCLQSVPTFDLPEPLIENSPSPEGVALNTLAPFDTICVKTRNSDYRIFLLDPATGRALIEGGRHFAEPVEAVVNGSMLRAAPLKGGWIGIGLRIGFWADGNFVSTSPVQSFHIEHRAANEAVLSFSGNFEN
jgi:RNA polymerase-binding transcription factor DksA